MVKPAANSASTTISGQASEPKYTGVRKRKWGKWVSEIRLPNSRERIWLGSYDTPEKAARAFDAALYCLRGRNANFNFPDSPPDFDGRESFSPQEIQAAAARFANAASGATTTTSNPESSFQAMDHYASTSSTLSDSAIQVDNSSSSVIDHTAMDWSFLGALDLNEGVSNCEIYSGLDNINNGYYPPLPSFFDDGNGDSHHHNNPVDDGDESYDSQCSYLWNFN